MVGFRIPNKWLETGEPQLLFGVGWIDCRMKAAPFDGEVEGPMNHLEMARPCKANKQNKVPTAQQPD